MKVAFHILKSFLTPPVFKDDPAKTQAAQLLYQIIRVIWVLPVLLVVIIVLNPAGRDSVVPPAIVIPAALLVLMAFTRRGWVGLVNYVFVAMTLLIFGYADYGNAGNVQPSTLITAIVIIMSGLLLGKRAPVVAAILIAFTHALIVYFQLQGLIVVTSAPALGFENMIITGIMLAMIGFLFQFVISRLQSAVDEARKNESELQVRNSELDSLSKSLEGRVAERTRQLSTVAEISTAAATIRNESEMLHSVVHLTQRRFGLYHAHIFIFDDARENLKIAACGWKEGDEHEGTDGTIVIPMTSQQSLVARAARTRKAVIVNDVHTDPGWLPNPTLPEAAAELAVPLVAGDTVVGVLDVQADHPDAFTPQDADIQTTLASQVAIALQNARLFTQAETSRQEARSLVDYAPEAIVVVNLETGLFLEPNGNAETLYGLSHEDLLKVGPAQMSPPVQPDGRDSTGKAMEKINAAMQGEPQVFEWTHRNSQGEDIPCEVRLVRLPGPHPRVRASVTDITERKRYEQLTAQRVKQQEAINQITQRIQSATTVQTALQIAARELGHALGMKPTQVSLESFDPDRVSSGKS